MYKYKFLEVGQLQLVQQVVQERSMLHHGSVGVISE